MITAARQDKGGSVAVNRTAVLLAAPRRLLGGRLLVVVARLVRSDGLGSLGMSRVTRLRTKSQMRMALPDDCSLLGLPA